VIVLLPSCSIVWIGNKGPVGYPSDVSDEEWAFVAPYLVLCREDARFAREKKRLGLREDALETLSLATSVRMPCDVYRDCFL
jgi:hypothetical protein